MIGSCRSIGNARDSSKTVLFLGAGRIESDRIASISESRIAISSAAVLVR